MSRLRGREILAAGSFFALASIVFTWPLAARLPNGMPDLWDDKLNAWIFHWDFHQFFRDPLKLFDANIFYPAHGTLAFSENLFGAAVFGFPLFAAGASTLVTANVLMLLGMTLSGIGAWALARHVTLDPAVSLVAGIVYAFVPWRIAQLPHVQFQWGAFLALLLLFLLRSLESGRARDAALFGLFFAWNALTNVHYALFSGFLVALVLAHAALTYDRPIFLRRARSIVFAGAIACVLVLPFYLPYVRASRTYGMVRGEGEIESYSGRPIDFLTAGPQNKLYAPLTQKWGHGEGDFFPGLTALALAIFALVHLRGSAPERAARVSMRRRHAARVLDVAIAAALLLALAAAVFHRTAIGPIKVRDPGRIVAIVGLVAIVRLVIAFPSWSRFADLSDFARRARVGSRATLFSSIAALGVLVALGTHTPFYRILVQSFGSVFRAIRVPGRGIVLFDLALGVLAAWGLARATSAWRPRARIAALGLALLLITVEYRAFPIDIGDVPERPALVYRWLATVPLRGAVVEWPLGFEFDPEHVFRSTAHWKPLVNGYSGFAPPAYNALHGLLDGRRIPDTVWNAMRRLGGSVLLFHPTEMRDETVRAHADVLRRGLREGRIAPLGAFSRPGEETPDLAFRLAGAPPFRVEVPAGQALASLADALLLIDRIETRRTAPFGVIDHPAEDGEVMAGYWAFGWALDDSGVAGVALHADGGAPVDCAVHAAYPGVAALYGAYPESKSPGFGCPVPRLAPGRHLLSFEVTARDGGKTVLKRAVFVRAGG